MVAETFFLSDLCGIPICEDLKECVFILKMNMTESEIRFNNYNVELEKHHLEEFFLDGGITKIQKLF